MENTALIAKLSRTKLSGDRTAELVGKLLRREFDQTNSKDYALEVLTVAYQFNVPQLDEMMADYNEEDYLY